MAAPKGNQFWKARTKHGKDKLFKDPDVLWQASCEYFEWVDDNPIIEYKVTQYQGEVVTMPVPKMRAMTLEGLWLFLNISKSAWYDYKLIKDYMEVIERIENTIRQQKFSGAAADQLNANIIARDLGLSDKSELTGEGGGPIKTQSKVEWVVQPVKALNETDA
jgi:hypothetical protein